jgi:single-stranded DNA-binding protein
MQDLNECRMTGTIERIKSIPTRTGSPMAEVLLLVRRDKFRVVAFKNLADHLITHAAVGDRLAVTGSLSVSSWRDEVSQEWRNSFAVTAWGVELSGEKVSYQREQLAPPPNGARRRDEMHQAGPGDPF